MNKVKINKEQQVYVIPAGKGFSCLGFDVCIDKGKLLAKELGVPFSPRRGSLKAYNEYSALIDMAREKYQKTGWRSQSELYAPFIGHEGERVEVEYTDGSKERFYIGRSTGWVPCHLVIKKSNSMGGGAVLNSLIKSFKFVTKPRNIL